MLCFLAQAIRRYASWQNKQEAARGWKHALDTFGAEEEIGEMVGGAVGAISAIDRLYHLADLEG